MNSMNLSDDLSMVKSALDKAERYIRSGLNYRETIELLTPLLDALYKSGSTQYLIEALYYLGICYLEVGLLPKARISFEEGLKIARTTANQDWIANCLHELSQIARQEGKLSDAIDLCSEAFNLSIEAELDIDSIVMNLTVIYQMLGMFSKAKEILDIVRVNCERSFDVGLLAKILNETGLVEFELGNYKEGVLCFIDAVHFKSILGDRHGIQKSIANLQRCLMRFPSAMTDPEIKYMIDRTTR